MARVLERTWVTGDERYAPERDLAEKLKISLENLEDGRGLDTYNKTYVVRVTIDVVDC